MGVTCGADFSASPFPAAAFRVALALAMVSRKALDDLEAFLVSLSACCSGVSSSCNVEAADTYRDAGRVAAEGDCPVDADSAWGFLVFRTWSGRSGGPISNFEGFDDVLLGDGRAGEGLATAPSEISCLGLSKAAFLGVKLLSAPPTGLEDDDLIRDGLSLEFGILLVGTVVEDGTDMRDREGRRSLDTGCDKNSLPG